MIFLALVLVPSNVNSTVQPEWSFWKAEILIILSVAIVLKSQYSLILVCNALQCLFSPYIPVLIFCQSPLLCTMLNTHWLSTFTAFWHVVPFSCNSFLPYWLPPILGLSLPCFLDFIRQLCIYPFISSLTTLIICVGFPVGVSFPWEWKLCNGPEGRRATSGFVYYHISIKLVEWKDKLTFLHPLRSRTINIQLRSEFSSLGLPGDWEIGH